MYIKNKYLPLTFKESLLNLELIQKLSKLKEIINLQLIGINGTGKYILSLLYLENLYGKKIYEKKIIEKYSIKILHSNYHYEIILTIYFCKSDLISFLESIKDITTINNSTINIIIKNAQYLDKTCIKFIEQIINNNSNLRIIIISNKHFYTNKFKILFLVLRIPKIKYNELYNLVSKINSQEKLKIKKKNIKLLINLNKFNISKIILFLDKNYIKFISNLNIDFYKKNILEIKLLEIIEIMKNKDINSIVLIREKLYDIISKNIKEEIIFTFIFKNILSNTKNKYEYIKKINILENKKKKYKNIIHLEQFIIISLNFI